MGHLRTFYQLQQLYNIEWYEWKIMSGELKRIAEQVVMAHIKVLYGLSLGGTENNYMKPQSVLSLTWQRCKQEPPKYNSEALPLELTWSVSLYRNATDCITEKKARLQIFSPGFVWLVKECECSATQNVIIVKHRLLEW